MIGAILLRKHLKNRRQIQSNEQQLEVSEPYQSRSDTQDVIQWELEQKGRVLGALKIKYLVIYFMTLTFFAPVYSYYKAVSSGQEHPYPAATITQTACHYPQATVFRFLNLQAGSFLSLLYFVLAKWIESEKKRIRYPHSTATWLFWPCQLSILGFLEAIGTIDIKGTGNYHGPGAVFFFIVLYLAVLNYTIVMRKMHNWDTTFMSRSSFIIKSLLCLYVSCVAVYFFVGLLFDSQMGNDFGKGDKYVVIMEWNLVLICEVWVFSFWQDWKTLSIVLTDNGKVLMQKQQFPLCENH